MTPHITNRVWITHPVTTYPNGVATVCTAHTLCPCVGRDHKFAALTRGDVKAMIRKKFDALVAKHGDANVHVRRDRG
jgi:hypothetical protein